VLAAQRVGEAIPPADAGRPGSFGFWRDEVAYHRALDWRLVEGNFDVMTLPPLVRLRLRPGLLGHRDRESERTRKPSLE